MAKSTQSSNGALPWFKHSSKLHADPDLQVIVSKFGPDAYVVWCVLLEFMYSTTMNDWGHLPWDDDYKPVYAKACFTTPEKFKAITDYMIDPLQWLEVKDNLLSNDHVTEMFKERYAERECDRLRKIKERERAKATRVNGYGSITVPK